MTVRSSWLIQVCEKEFPLCLELENVCLISLNCALYDTRKHAHECICTISPENSVCAFTSSIGWTPSSRRRRPHISEWGNAFTRILTLDAASFQLPHILCSLLSVNTFRFTWCRRGLEIGWKWLLYGGHGPPPPLPPTPNHFYEHLPRETPFRGDWKRATEMAKTKFAAFHFLAHRFVFSSGQIETNMSHL